MRPLRPDPRQTALEVLRLFRERKQQTGTVRPLRVHAPTQHDDAEHFGRAPELDVIEFPEDNQK